MVDAGTCFLPRFCLKALRKQHSRRTYPKKGSEGVGGHFGNWRLIAQIVWMFKPEKFKSFVIKQDAEKMLRVDYSSR
jgi:hypothetical protein